jgi:hypothetical protein
MTDGNRLYRYRGTELSVNALIGHISNDPFSKHEIEEIIATNSLQYVLSEINGNLWCAEPEGLNDPFDGIGVRELDNWKIVFDTTDDPMIEGNEYIVPIELFYFVACFSNTWSSAPMWAHYSRFTGVCLGYDHKKLDEWVKGDSLTLPQRGLGFTTRLREVDYNLKVPFVDTDDKIVEDDFFRKTEEWEYEGEWRIVAKADEGAKKNRGILIPTGDCLAEITLGHQINDKIKDAIINECLNLKRDIDLYQAKVENGLYERDPI